MLIYSDTCTVQCTHYNILHRTHFCIPIYIYIIRLVVVIVVVVVVVESIIFVVRSYNTCINCMVNILLYVL